MSALFRFSSDIHCAIFDLNGDIFDLDGDIFDL